MNTKSDKERIISSRMAKRGVLKRDIEFFLSAWRDMEKEEEKTDWQQIRPVADTDVFSLITAQEEEKARLEQLGTENLGRCAIVKLNGGRSTTMGGHKPKCMVEAKDGLSFLDIVMGQIMAANDANGVEMPLVLMNSFFTDHITEKIIGRTPLIIMNFIQNEYPRIKTEDLMPLDTGHDEDWCPGGHGDFYTSLSGSGLLESLLKLDYHYVFISNIDNLSAEVSPLILGKMIDDNLDFVMEVTRKTAADVKGGAPVYYKDQLSLLEIAQVPEENIDDFQNIDRFCYFNTNNLWVDLRSLKTALDTNQLNLPIILNRKNICDTDIIQIETAMGAGIQCFNNPGIVEVPRNRFAPVKKLSDLFMLQSDLYVMNDQYQIRKNPNRDPNLPPMPAITFHSGFPAGNELKNGFVDPSSVSLLGANSFTVGGDVVVEKDLVVTGDLVIEE